LSNGELGMLWMQNRIIHGLWMMDLDVTTCKLHWNLELGGWDLKGGVVDRLQFGG
jgi:hypothetical protein